VIFVALPGTVAGLWCVTSLDTIERIDRLHGIVRVTRAKRIERVDGVQRLGRVHDRGVFMRCAKLILVTVVCLAAASMARPLKLHAAEPLQAIVESYLQIHSQLVTDKTDGVKAAAGAIVKQAASMGANGAAIGKAATAVASAADLKTTRQAFGPLSDAVIAAVSASGPATKKELGLKLAFCPMVNRSWLQKEDKIRNPYYGSTMLVCGEMRA